MSEDVAGINLLLPLIVTVKETVIRLIKKDESQLSLALISLRTLTRNRHGSDRRNNEDEICKIGARYTCDALRKEIN